MINYYHLERFGIAREGLQLLIPESAGYRLAGSSGESAEFLRQLPLLSIKILLLDMDLHRDQALPINLCLDLCMRVKEEQREINIVLHSPFEYAGWINRFLDLGVRGFVSKKSGFQQLLICFDDVLKKKIFICPELSKQFSNTAEFMKNKMIPLKPTLNGFTSRELEILALISSGCTSKEISTQLEVSPKTVETHRKNLVRKAKTKNTCELVDFASRQGIIVL